MEDFKKVWLLYLMALACTLGSWYIPAPPLSILGVLMMTLTISETYWMCQENDAS